jgi:hypothetical protein
MGPSENHPGRTGPMTLRSDVMSITTDPTSTGSNPATATTTGSTPVTPPVAIDLYRDIHKGIRAELFGATLQAGDLDPSDRGSRLALAGRIDALVALLHSHAEHEDGHIQPAIEKVLPDAAARIVADHDLLDRRIGDIQEMSVVVAETTGTQARAVGHELYLELASFTSAYLSHQDLEERVVMPTLAAALGPDTVLGIHQAIISSIPPAEMATALAVMIPAMNVDDRTEMLGGMQAGAPPEVFAGVWGLVGSVLVPADVAALAARLGIDA